MRCKVARSQLQDLLEGRLPPGLAIDLRGHLTSCPGCATELTSWQNLWADLTGLAPCATAPDLGARIIAAIEDLSDLPRGLMLLFLLASLGTLGGLFAWAESLEAGRNLISAYLWAAAGVASVTTIWLAVKHSYHPDAPAAQEE